MEEGQTGCSQVSSRSMTDREILASTPRIQNKWHLFRKQVGCGLDGKSEQLREPHVGFLFCFFFGFACDFHFGFFILFLWGFSLSPHLSTSTLGQGKRERKHYHFPRLVCAWTLTVSAERRASGTTMRDCMRGRELWVLSAQKAEPVATASVS